MSISRRVAEGGRHEGAPARRRSHPHADRDVHGRVGRLQPAPQRRGSHARSPATRASSPTACSHGHDRAHGHRLVGVGRVTKYGVRFVRQVWPGDTLTATATVDAIREEDGVHYADVSITTVNQDGTTSSAAPRPPASIRSPDSFRGEFSESETHHAMKPRAAAQPSARASNSTGSAWTSPVTAVSTRAPGPMLGAPHRVITAPTTSWISMRAERGSDAVVTPDAELELRVRGAPGDREHIRDVVGRGVPVRRRQVHRDQGPFRNVDTQQLEVAGHDVVAVTYHRLEARRIPPTVARSTGADPAPRPRTIRRGARGEQPDGETHRMGGVVDRRLLKSSTRSERTSSSARSPLATASSSALVRSLPGMRCFSSIRSSAKRRGAAGSRRPRPASPTDHRRTPGPRCSTSGAARGPARRHTPPSSRTRSAGWGVGNLTHELAAAVGTHGDQQVVDERSRPGARNTSTRRGVNHGMTARRNCWWSSPSEPSMVRPVRAVDRSGAGGAPDHLEHAGLEVGIGDDRAAATA